MIEIRPKLRWNIWDSGAAISRWCYDFMRPLVQSRSFTQILCYQLNNWQNHSEILTCLLLSSFFEALVGIQNLEFLSQSVDQNKKCLWLELVTPYYCTPGAQRALHKPLSVTAAQLSGRPSTLLMWRLAVFVAEVIGQKQSLVINWFSRSGRQVTWCSCTAMWRCNVTVFLFCTAENWLHKSEGPTVWNVCTYFCAYWQLLKWISNCPNISQA